jgi:ATP-dependent exoDNAse (exonuclease V) beta subunit
MKPLAHVMILASAGSGKTYALTTRFVELLARGAAADRIVALTFTRKAAGEFFDEILQKLARAASDRKAAGVLARDIDAPHLGSSDFLRMLREVVDGMHRLRLGTLDSFFARIARAFPFELGLEGEFEVLEEFTARIERQRVLRRMFTHAGKLDTAQKEFIEAFKRATFGLEEKQLAPRLDAFLDAHQEHFLEARDAALWGDPRRIWPLGNAWLEANVDRAAAARVLAAWTETAPISEKHRERWRRFLGAVTAWSPGVQITTDLAYVLTKALATWPALTAGRAVLEFNRRKQELSVDACAALADLTRHVVGAELLRRIATTRGIHAVLCGYDRVYHDMVRRAGKLTFADVQRLLLPDGAAGELTRDGGKDSRLFIDYRLDAEIDHWLLDEFQDTSYGQWSVLRNLIDEVVQDTGGTRSFFCVGDIKQAIFAWREGDPHLFREIFEHYNAAAPGAVVTRHLTDSWRSGPPVIELVNAIFGDAAAIDELFPGPAAKTWNREWRNHVSAQPERGGQAALLVAWDETERWRRVVEILHEIRPLERGLTCAVLVQTNSVATELADFLRREGGVPAVAESDLHVCVDNPLGAALLALMQAAAYPGDSMAWEHVQMTPLGPVLADEGIGTREAATLRLLGQLHAEGFERTVELWLEKVEARLDSADAFSRMRARQFAAAAANFDRTGSRDVAEFVQFMERHVIREPESAAVVRVMTIHKSKGLGFDVVFLPDLEGKRIDLRREGLAVQKAKDRTVEWILDLPPKLFYEADDVLSRHVKVAEADACYEALSLLYVALTRAKRATYAIVEPSGTSTSRNYPKLLSETLGAEQRVVGIGSLALPGLWMSGDAHWHTQLERSTAEQREVSSSLVPLPPGPRERVVGREVRRPSGEMPRSAPVAQLFSLETGAAAAFGAAVHSLLAEVEWRSGNDVTQGWRTSGASAAAIAEADACLQAPALSGVWNQPGRAEVWRERAFEIVLDDAWVTGVFDRVIVERNGRNGVEWVTVLDFKTDRVDDERALTEAVRRHSPQLNVYRRVAAALTGVAIDAVTCELVFTRVQRKVRVPAA